MTGAVRMVQRNALVYRRVWRGSLFFSFLQPMLFLTAMGVGLAFLIDPDAIVELGVNQYLDFLGPGLLAAAAMQTASFESSFPITGKMTWQRNYEAISATPMRIRDLVLGELAWMAIRISTVAIAFYVILLFFGVPWSPISLLAVPSAVLTGLAFSASIITYAAQLKNAGGFNGLFRFVIMPLFLFSGTFFDIETRLPEAAQVVAWFTPLFHGVQLTRGLMLDRIDSPNWLIHAGYLLAMMLIGIGLALWTFRRKLRP